MRCRRRSRTSSSTRSRRRPVDLDLGSPADAPGMIQNLAPSERARAGDDVSGLTLDLSTGEAVRHAAAPADFGSAGLVDLEVGHDDASGPPSDEHVKVVGPLRIGIPLFNIYLNEADELSRRLMTEVAEWAMELHRPVGEVPIALAHSLAGSSATVGFTDLSHLARSLEHALARTQVIGHGTDEEARLFVDAAEEIRRLLHQFAAGFLQEPSPELLARLAEHEVSSALRLEAATAASELAEGQDSESPIEPRDRRRAAAHARRHRRRARRQRLVRRRRSGRPGTDRRAARRRRADRACAPGRRGHRQRRGRRGAGVAADAEPAMPRRGPARRSRARQRGERGRCRRRGRSSRTASSRRLPSSAASAASTPSASPS